MFVYSVVLTSRISCIVLYLPLYIHLQAITATLPHRVVDLDCFNKQRNLLITVRPLEVMPSSVRVFRSHARFKNELHEYTIYIYIYKYLHTFSFHSRDPLLKINIDESSIAVLYVLAELHKLDASL